MSDGARRSVPQHTGSTRSESPLDDKGPPLPPKPSKKFGFNLRSVSMPFHHREKADKYTPPLSPAPSGPDDRHSPAKANKQSRVLGSNIGSQEDNFDAKLARLREMGFNDSRRNSEVLKSNNGNLDRTVGDLVRSGEASKQASRALTPVSAGSASINGISVEKKRQPDAAKNGTLSLWEALDNEQPPQRAVTMPIMYGQSINQPQSSMQQSYNPFMQQSQHYQQPQHYQQDLSHQQAGLQTAFSDMHVLSQLVQPSSSSGTYNPFYDQGSQIPYQAQAQNHAQPQQQQQHVPNQLPHAGHGGYTSNDSNPFLRITQSQTFNHGASPQQQQPVQQSSQVPIDPWSRDYQQPFLQTLQVSSSGDYGQQGGCFASQHVGAQQQQVYSNPFYSSQRPGQDSLPSDPWGQSRVQQTQRTQSSQQPQGHEQLQRHQQNHQDNGYQSLQQTQTPNYMQQQPIYASNSPHEMPQPQSQQGFNPGAKFDKSSILALYNAPHLAPPPPASSPAPESGELQSPHQAFQSPVSGSMNPFGASQGQQASAGAQDPDHYQTNRVTAQQIKQDAFSGLSNRWR